MRTVCLASFTSYSLSVLLSGPKTLMFGFSEQKDDLEFETHVSLWHFRWSLTSGLCIPGQKLSTHLSLDLMWFPVSLMHFPYSPPSKSKKGHVFYSESQCYQLSPVMPSPQGWMQLVGSEKKTIVWPSLLRSCWGLPWGLEIQSKMTQLSHGFILQAFFFFPHPSPILVFSLCSFWLILLSSKCKIKLLNLKWICIC